MLVSIRDYFVTLVAVVIGCLALASALRVPLLGLEQRAYQLRSVKAIEQRWGDAAARALLLAVAALMFFMGAAIVVDSQSSSGEKTRLPESALQ